MQSLISIRLRAQRWFKKHPEILDQELYPIILISGLQRTGTTKLHRLLAADPDNRVLWSWEAINPVPLGKYPAHPDPRIKIARTTEKALKLMAPGFFAIHPVEHLAPEEDILLLDTTFLSTTPEATMHVPSYAQWLEKTDQSMAYEYGAKLLRLLQWQHPGKRWILKTPHHLEFFDLVEKYYGDVRYLWTHRDITESIPSFLSMVSHSRAIFSDKTDMNVVGKHWTRKSGYMLDKAIEFRTTNNRESKFMDIWFEDSVSKPMEILAKIYNNEGGISKELLRKFQDAERDNPAEKYGVHKYGLKDFGLEDEDVKRYTRGYREFMMKKLTVNNRK